MDIRHNKTNKIDDLLNYNILNQPYTYIVK